MDENEPKENPPADFNKIDLSQLQGFSFGTQWTQDKNAGGGDKGGRSDRPRRDGVDSPVDRRDRRGFRRPEGAPAEPGGDPRGPGGPGGPGGPRREFAGGGGGDRRPRPEGRDFRGGAGGDRRGPGGDRAGFSRDRGPAYEQRAPYDSPYFSVTFYPEDTSFNALVKTVRASCRTIELFEIARTVLGKPERFTVLLTRRDPNAPRAGVPARQSAPAQAAGEGGEAPSGADAGAAAPAGAKDPAKEPIFLSVPDSLPFESEDAAISYVLSKHLAQFLDTAEVETDPPKGSFQVINRCAVTGELLGPPNYHRYNQIVQQHYASKAIRMPFDAYRSRIESVRDPAVVQQWLDKMKKVTRYTSKLPVPEGQAPVTFDAWEDARAYVLAQAKDKIVRGSGHARFHGRAVESLPPGEIRRAVEGTLERQRRFPLDTANALRGRLRREHFTIFKKGAKGVSYVCAVKRKFRTPGQTFAETIGGLIDFIEKHPMVKAGDLPQKLLGLGDDAAAAGEGALSQVLSVEQREKIARLQGDLLWLVREGYVTEFIDGTLYAPPPMVEARRKEVERDDNDPENFPDRPAGAAPAASAEGAGEQAAEESSAGGDAAEAGELGEDASPTGAVAPATAESADHQLGREGGEQAGSPAEAASVEAAPAETAPAEAGSPAPSPTGGGAPGATESADHQPESHGGEQAGSPAETAPANHRMGVDAPTSAQSADLSQGSLGS